MKIQFHKVLSISTCYSILRELRWEKGVFSSHCESGQISKKAKMMLVLHTNGMCAKLVGGSLTT